MNQEQNPVKVNHPYEEYVDNSLWQVVSKAIEDLVNNGDIKETTNRKYIIGYLCKKISELNKPD